MASLNTFRNSYKVAYRDPRDGKRKQRYFKTKEEAIIALGHWQQVELYAKNNMNWRALLYNEAPQKTLDEIFTAFTNNVLSTLTNVDTIAKYNVVINSCKKVFPGNTIASEVRTTSQNVMGVAVTGWTIYKHIMEYQHNRSRRGIDSYMRDLLHIFNWAYEEELIDKRIMRKSDRYKKHELAPLTFKVWSNEEINYIFNHSELSQEQKDILWLFAITGVRANELVGHNTKKPYKELHWHHIDFIGNKMQLLQKRRQIRETASVHPSAIAILKKRFRSGADRPLDMNYKELNALIKQISSIVAIKFTCHDLRRMKAQVLRNETQDVTQASKGIGDKTTEVVHNHYAGTTIEEQQAINDTAYNAFIDIVKQ
jgi:integrase